MKSLETASSGQTDWDKLEKLLLSLVGQQKPGRLKALNDIFKSAVRVAKESPGTLNLKITANVLKELRYSFKMFFPHRYTPKITMFGSARVPASTPLYAFAKNFAAEAVSRRFMIMTGGGPGIMAAGNEGAENGQGFGLNIRLPMEQSANPFIDKENRLINYKYFFTRKLFLVKEACAFAFFPGGFGTFDEAFEVLTLLQTGKTSLIPVILMEPKGLGFWKAYEKFADALMKGGFISEDDKHLYHVFNTAKDGIAHIEHFYSQYHSMRLVKDQLVLRIRKPVEKSLLDAIHKRFSALSGGAKFVMSGPLPDESNEPEFNELHRIVFPFAKHDYGLLRRLVDFLNDSAAV